ncbi:hypothetical protein [Quadrisphaera setariae]|uniref:Phosphoserine phosphatase n=1 Tax=Quadrisphaera setariae TaxID=2593304 RepID=A0A5C8Z3B3_9ACTN|nr:hypothetical protein [Quadrisphaera setariae]TXR51688.1 hypothetical protein FMM08_21945 [Quadrisphaera setariae]
MDRVVVVDHCRRRDWLPVLTSLAWTVVTAHLAQRFGFALSGGPAPGVVDGAFTGGVGRYWDERAEALAVAAAHGVAPARCLTLGDSRSDLPLFAAVGGTVAVNASAECVAAASTSLMTQDLADANPLLDDLAASGC